MFDNYQKQAMGTFKEHQPLTAEQSRMLNWAIGLSGEVGEVEEVIKHAIWGQEDLDKMELAKELGDVLWYLTAICTTADIPLSAVAELNASKLAHRYEDQGYDVLGSTMRHSREKDFEKTLIYQNLRAKILKLPAPMNVIFVGPDGSGKTTAAKMVAERLATEGFTYHKCNYAQENKPELCQQLLDDGNNVIYDRFYYPDDIIYSRIVHERDHEEPMDWNTDYWKEYNRVLDKLSELNTLYFYVTASPEVLRERSTHWADDYVVETELPKISALYDRWKQAMRVRPMFMVDVDTTEKTPEEVADFCVEVIHRAQGAFANLDPETFTGKENEDGNAESEM